MRTTVELKNAYRLINHGPVTLVAASAAGRMNVMAAAWVMPVDFEPPLVGAVIARGTYTRSLVDASGEFTLNLPTRAMADITYTLGCNSGHDIDKFARLRLKTAPSSRVGAPLIEGCVGWMECRVRPDDGLTRRYDLIVAEVVAAWARTDVFQGGQWRFTSDDHRTIHHVAGGAFFVSGDRVDARMLDVIDTPGAP